MISGKARLDIEPLSLAGVIAEAVESVRHAAESKGITVVETTDPLAPPIFGDRTRLRQVFWNLFSNAIKFTPRNGRIEVRQHQTGRTDGEAEVVVRDNGQGIAEEFLPYIFDRFRQMDSSASRRHGGLGLGLSIVKQLTELHGGTVRVASGGVGKGSVFTVTLPVGEAASKPGAVPAIHEPVPAPAPPRAPRGEMAVHDGHARGAALAGVELLLVEDDVDQRNLLRRIFEQQGAAVRVADDADRGLELLRARPPQVLVSDIGLPGTDGYEFLRRVRELPADGGGKVPAVALTAFARAEDRQLALRAGFQTHVTKPAEASELINVIANLASLAK